LKAAVCRAWGEERCPEAVRSRVLAAAAGRDATAAPVVITPPESRDPSFWQQPWLRYGLAAAAMMVIGFGLASRLDNSGNDIGLGTQVTFTSTVPAPIAQGLLESHDRCSKYPSHNAPGFAAGDFATMRRQLEQRLKFPVLAGNIEEALGANGWKFTGAAVCKVGDLDAAHLVFVRRGQAISIFSLPPYACRHADSGAHECEDSNPDHPVAVFVWSDGVHCVVGSSDDRSLSVDEVRAVLEHLRPTLPATPTR
jgi:hypothetical protein